MTLQSIVAGMLLVFSVHKEDKAQLEAKAHQEMLLSAAIARESEHAPLPPREWAALMLAVAENESHGRLRIQEGRCKQLECDRGRARGLWQMHRNKHNAAVWDQMVGVENTDVQVHAASEQLKRAYWTCAKKSDDKVAGAILAFAGRTCDSRWPGLARRMASYRKFLKARAVEQ